MTWLLDPPPQPFVHVLGTDAHLPVRRIWCVGRNYAAHVREMGGDPTRDPPFFFAKPADALVAVTAGETAQVPYPPQTADFHHEVELVVALGKGGKNLSPQAALQCVAGYAVGIDLTRRDLQAKAKKAGQPWEMAKGFDHSAVCGPLVLASALGHPASGAIALQLDGETKQSGNLDQMIWSVADTLAYLSQLVELAPGDLVYTGTPEGVGPMMPGQVFVATIAGLPDLRGAIVASIHG